MKKGDCVLCKQDKPRSDSTSAHSDQGLHCLSMYSTVTSVSLGTQLKMLICLLGFLDHCRNGPFQTLMFISCFDHFVFIAWVIDQTITLSSGLRLLVLSYMMSSR